MNEILEILKYVAPSAVVFATAYYILQTLVQRDNERQRNEAILGNQKLITPLRLQAYERMALLLERISPESLVIRVLQPKMTAKQLQSELIGSIRQEFEHNLSQQIYMTNDAWETVVNAKESINQLVNVAATRINMETASAIDLSKVILDMYMNVEQSPIKKALIFIKSEIQLFMESKPLRVN